MAADSDFQDSFSEFHELSRAVTKTINDFSSDEGHVDGFDNGFNASSFQAEKKSVQDQLLFLEKEIADLEHQIECQSATENLEDQDLERLKDFLGKQNDEDYSEDHRQAVRELTKQILLLEKLTGITFRKCACTLKKYESRHTERRYVIDGDSFGLPFQMEFDVVERQVAESLINAYVSSLKIAVDEAVVDELESLIISCEDNNSVNMFLRSFSNFSRLFSQRKKTFHHFQEKYPNAVELPRGENGATMQFSHLEDSGAVWTISWEMLISGTSEVLPDVQLFVKASTEMIDLDDGIVLRKAPENFRSMLQHLGIEQAIDTMIKIATSL